MATMQSEPDHLDAMTTREFYQRQMVAIRTIFDSGTPGLETVRSRSDLVDGLIRKLWKEAIGQAPHLGRGVALVAVGGYGRRELYPCSDVDLLFLLDSRISDKTIEKTIKDPIRRMNQALWDCGMRVTALTRKLSECDQFDATNAEFSLALIDRRAVCGDVELQERLNLQLPKFFRRERGNLLRRLAELTSARHAKYGDTLFHLEPNIKDCPGGLRDAHACEWTAWLAEQGKLSQAKAASGTEANNLATNGIAMNVASAEFKDAVAFLRLLRCFLHFRHERDDNTLDWEAQDAAAKAAVGLGGRGVPAPGAAYWMRLYFRNARVVERRTIQTLETVPLISSASRLARLTSLKSGLKELRRVEKQPKGFLVDNCAVIFTDVQGRGDGVARVQDADLDPAHDPETVLSMFEAMSRLGCRLGVAAEERLSQALPLLSADLEEGPALWRHFEAILRGPYAGSALRAMHALGILELLIPEFHGIDALVIRDAYHRYTVDEHTFVLIDTLHDLETRPPFTESQAGTRAHKAKENPHPMAEWAGRFGQLLRDLQQPGLLYLVALLHDTGKGRNSGDHAQESARMAENVLSRLELDGYESSIVVRSIKNHLEMSAALRRDIFDTDTVRGFAAKVQTPEALRILTLFTYADIQAVHPDALTPWKAENLWRLYLATSNYLDRNVDEERVGARNDSELVLRVTAMMPDRRAEVEAFLEGLPERYLSTRTPEQVRSDFERSVLIEADPVQLEFRYAPGVNEMTLVTRDRPLLFANMAGALAAWGMNIVTADAFSNRAGVVVDSFRFTDAFRTLEMNASERERFTASVHDVLSGAVAVERLLEGRRRGRRRPPKTIVKARVDFDDAASTHSTLLQVVALDMPGLLHVLSLTLAQGGYNIEVALVDTEGETAIDVFYVTRAGRKLSLTEQKQLNNALLGAMRDHD